MEENHDFNFVQPHIVVSFAADLDSTLPGLPNEPGSIPRPYRDRTLRWDTLSGVSVFQRLVQPLQVLAGFNTVMFKGNIFYF